MTTSSKRSHRPWRKVATWLLDRDGLPKTSDAYAKARYEYECSARAMFRTLEKTGYKIVKRESP